MCVCSSVCEGDKRLEDIICVWLCSVLVNMTNFLIFTDLHGLIFERYRASLWKI